MAKKTILWVDDEIEFLQPHILFLRDKNYQVETATNADDALTIVKQRNVDLVLLDEMMPGKDGLTALGEIKAVQPGLPVIMITKNEEESLMEDAIGSKVDDYLTKPVNPSQILLACKKFLESRDISQRRLTESYSQRMNEISMKLMQPLDYPDWIDIYRKLSIWDLELRDVDEHHMRDVIYDQRRECNVEFGKYIERNYQKWINDQTERPRLSVDIVKDFVFPEMEKGRRVVFVVIDCLRLDQWLTLEPFFYKNFTISKEYYYSILPTATPFSRNAIFSGLYPLDIERRYPELWSQGEDDDYSRNRYEDKLMYDQLRVLGLKFRKEPKYVKILNSEDTRNLEKNLLSLLDAPMLSIVLNFVDILAHSRSDLPILKEIAPDEPSYRSLTRSWFEHSPLYNVFKMLAQQDVTIFLTSDHGSVRSLRGTKVIGDRETSTNLRYKFGRNLKAEPKHAIFIKNPKDYKLPQRNFNLNYIIAKEDYYFVYPTNYHKYLAYYRDSFQHGGVSLEEMILPVVRLDPRNI
ncbi:MAG: response regulator [Calditrichaeota bacterium]|nr:response regulator [Calditrichota bacterium]RQW04777.1 MAG: response regulator [Calditrichota bacterium]